jgi:hypothetical protein
MPLNIFFVTPIKCWLCLPVRWYQDTLYIPWMCLFNNIMWPNYLFHPLHLNLPAGKLLTYLDWCLKFLLYDTLTPNLHSTKCLKISELIEIELGIT